MTHGREKSDPAIVAVKPTNKAGDRSGAGGAKGGGQGEREPAKHAPDTGTGKRVTGAGACTASRKATEEGEVHCTPPPHQHRLPGIAFFAIKREAASGVDGLTWPTYEADLDRNLTDLHERIHRGAYRALPSRRTYIPKADGKQRPLAIAALEDKIVQRATAAVLDAIYEEDFIGFRYGFRPKRGQHNALDALVVGIEQPRVNCILDSDVSDAFSIESAMTGWCDSSSTAIGDPRIIRLIQKWLKVGVLENGKLLRSVKRNGAGSGNFTAARQRLPALRVRPLGRALATARGHRRHDPHALCRRHGAGLRARGRGPALLGRYALAVREFSLFLYRTKPADRVWPLCSGPPRSERARETGDLQLLGFHLHLW